VSDDECGGGGLTVMAARGELSGVKERSGARCCEGEEETRRRCEWSVGWRRSEGAGSRRS